MVHPTGFNPLLCQPRSRSYSELQYLYYSGKVNGKKKTEEKSRKAEGEKLADLAILTKTCVASWQVVFFFFPFWVARKSPPRMLTYTARQRRWGGQVDNQIPSWSLDSSLCIFQPRLGHFIFILHSNPLLNGMCVELNINNLREEDLTFGSQF